MAKYALTFTLPYKLGAYDYVTLRERLERELHSYFDDRNIKAILTEGTEHDGKGKTTERNT